MQHTTTIMEEKEVITSMTCDLCGKETIVEDGYDLDSTEVIKVVHSFGYKSQYFGDGTKLECDICEACLYTLLKSKEALSKCCRTSYDHLLYNEN